MSQKMKYPCRDSTDDMKQRSKYLILLITCCRCHTGTRDHPWTIRKMALQFAKWVGRDRCFSRKGCIGNAPGFKINIRGRPTGLFPKSQQLWCSSQPAWFGTPLSHNTPYQLPAAVHKASKNCVRGQLLSFSGVYPPMHFSVM